MNIRDPSATLQRGDVDNLIGDDDHTHDTNIMNLSGLNNDGTNVAPSQDKSNGRHRASNKSLTKKGSHMYR